MNNAINNDTVLLVLAKHIGKSYGVSAGGLVMEITGLPSTAEGERRLRSVIAELREDGHHICAHPGRGYFIAKDAAELNEACDFLRDRAMTSLRQIAAMRRQSMPDLLGQLHLPT